MEKGEITIFSPDYLRQGYSIFNESQRFQKVNYPVFVMLFKNPFWENGAISSFWASKGLSQVDRIEGKNHVKLQ